jgi:hypothetical protein
MHLAKNALNLDSSIIWVGITNRYAILLNVEQKEGTTPFLTEEENEEYASHSITRHKSRGKFESKIGKLVYAFGSYNKIRRATVPINEEYYLLLTFNKEATNADEIITEKVIPLTEKHKHNFVV